MQLPHHRQFTTPLTATEAAAASGIASFAAQDRLAAPEGRPRWHPWAWGAALLLHVLAIAIVLLVRSRPPVQEGQSPPGVSVVFDNGGTAPEATAPPVVRQGPPQPAVAPPAATPPPPPPPPQAQAEVNLNMPQNPLAELPSAPQAQPTPQQKQPPHPHPRPALPQHYVMMDGMSYGTPSTNAAAPSSTHGKSLNLSLPQNDTQAVTGNDFAVHGNAGADWGAALTKWVSEHAYYPQAAIAQHQQGTAEVEFTVDRHGHVTGLRLLRSADSTFLDQAWELLFTDNQLPPFPADAKDDHVTVDYTVHYQLVP